MIVIKVLRRLLGGVKRLIRERTISSEEFVDHLRSCGCEIGKGCLFQSPQTACVDITRPVLVTIGDNCIIGFGSVVTKNIPANSVAVGAPARVICTLEEYYEKRKKQSYNEAMNLARIIYMKTGKRPTVEQMFEEFPMWMEGDQDDERLKFSVAFQTAGYHDIWKKQHKAPFRSFDEFIDKALENIEIRE